MSTRTVLLSQLKLAQAQKNERVSKLACVLEIARNERTQKLAGQLKEALNLSGAARAATTAAKRVPGQVAGMARNAATRVSNAYRGAVGRGATQEVGRADKAMASAQRTSNAANAMRPATVGARMIAGSPEHAAALARGAVFKSRGKVPMQNGVPMKPTTANLDKARGATTDHKTTQDIMAMQRGRRAAPKAKIQTPGANAQATAFLNADNLAAAKQRTAVTANRAAAPARAAHQFGQAARPYAAYGAGAVALGAGASAANSAQGLGREVTAGSLREKIAARIINADVGLDAIIAHIKNAKAKRVVTASA